MATIRAFDSRHALDGGFSARTKPVCQKYRRVRKKKKKKFLRYINLVQFIFDNIYMYLYLTESDGKTFL